MTEPLRVVALVPDLMDRSKISAAAPGEVEFVSSATGAIRRLRDSTDAGAVGDRIDLVIVDLSRAGVLDAVVVAKSVGAKVVGFGSHIDHDLLDAARAAGCDDVVARSVFFTRWLGTFGD